MTTLYETSHAGATYDPLPVEVWTWEGQVMGRVGASESMAFTYTDGSSPDTAVLDVDLDALTASLVPCDGTMLVAARYPGRTHLSVPVQAEVRAGEDPSVAVARITTAGGRSLLDAALAPPTLEGPLDNQDTEGYTLSGPLEDVVKRLISQGVARNGHPVVVLPSQGRGPSVTATGAWTNVGSTVNDLVTGTGYRLDVTGWVPGDPLPATDTAPVSPTILVDVVPLRDRDGLEWSTLAGDITDWSMTHKRATATRATVGYAVDRPEDRRYLQVSGPTTSPWAVRETYVKYDAGKNGEDDVVDLYRLAEDMENAGRTELAKGAATVSMDVDVEVSNLWRFGPSADDPRQFNVGDWVRVTLPVLGTHRQVVTEVEVKLTPAEFSVTPRVSTPYTMDPTLFSTVADVARRVTDLERR